MDRSPNREKWSLGPATFVTAAFIGPGTVTMCVIAGAKHGMSLLWALSFSLISTFILQNLSARVSIITRKNLEENILELVSQKATKIVMLVLMFSAIIVGNTAYQSGNISGAVLGTNLVFDLADGEKRILFTSLISLVALLIISIKNINLLTKWIFVLVMVMSICFFISALVVRPSFFILLRAMFIPSVHQADWFVIAGLVGTTIVPYNLFLHSNLAREKWTNSESGLNLSFIDTAFAILIGGVISISVVISSSLLEGTEVSSAFGLSQALEPVFGNFSKIIVGIGLIAAGISSAVTAPLAASIIASGLLNNRKPNLLEDIVKYGVLAIGYLFAVIGLPSLQLIQFAQVANAVLLPITAFLLLLITTKKKIMGSFVLKGFQKYLVFFVIIVCVVVAARGLSVVFSG